VEHADGRRVAEPAAIANSGFVSPEPEVLLPLSTAEHLALSEIAKPEAVRKALGDSSEAVMLRYKDAVNV